MKGQLVVTRPEHDPSTRYLSRWSEEIIEKAHEKGVHVVDLHREKAVREEVIGRLEKIGAALVVLNGHGDDDSVAGHENEVVLKSGDAKAVESKIIFARACRSAKTLGKNSVECGALAYLGYKEDFWLMYDETKISRPREDETAALFLKPSNHIALSLLKGHSAGEANAKSKALFQKNIEKLLVQESAVNYSAIRMLYWNMINQVCMGDEAVIFS